MLCRPGHNGTRCGIIGGGTRRAARDVGLHHGAPLLRNGPQPTRAVKGQDERPPAACAALGGRRAVPVGLGPRSRPPAAGGAGPVGPAPVGRP